MAEDSDDQQEIYVDEFGDPGNRPRIGESGWYEPSRIFGYAISIKGSKGDFATILIRQLDDNHRKKEKKARRLPDTIKESVASEIRKTDTICLAYYVDKLGELPDGWTDQSGSERMVGLLLYSVCKALKRTDAGEVLFIIDEHDAYKVKELYRTIECSFEKLSEDSGRAVGFCIASSSRGAYRMELQTHDLVANISLEKTERGYAVPADIAGVDIHQLGKSESIRLGKYEEQVEDTAG